MTRFAPRIAGAALCALAGLSLAGCSFLHSATADAAGRPSAPALPCPTATGGPLTLVVGARANSPAPELPPQIQALISATAAGGQEIRVILLDGTPGPVLRAQFAFAAQNPQMYNTRLRAFVNQAEAFVQGLKPKAPQADVLGALSAAARITPPGGTVVLMDSGIPTTGPLSFQNPDMFGADASDVASFVTAKGLLPGLTGESVVFVNLGVTAAPEPQLPKNLQTQIVDLWTAVAQKGGAACVYNLPSDYSRASVDTQVPVAVIPLPQPPVFLPCGTTTLSDSGTVGFTVGTSAFRDPAAARGAVQSLARLLIGHTQLVTLTGATSSEGGQDANKALSEQRAEAVKALLVGLGVDASRITTTGAGSDGPGHQIDLTPDGVLIPAAAEHNRSVTVDLTCRD